VRESKFGIPFGVRLIVDVMLFSLSDAGAQEVLEPRASILQACVSKMRSQQQA
jgi:hypothetical protein